MGIKGMGSVRGAMRWGEVPKSMGIQRRSNQIKKLDTNSSPV